MELLKTFNPDNLITFTESATQHLISQVEETAGPNWCELRLNA